MNRFLKPAAIAGAGFGILSGLPFVGCLNLACCALAVAGGFFASYLYLQNAPATAEPPFGDAAILGLLTGAIGAVVSLLVSLPFQLLGVAMGSMEGLAELLQEFDLPAEYADIGSFGAAGVFGVLMMIVGFLFNVGLYSVFAMLGALLGVGVLSRK